MSDTNMPVGYPEEEMNVELRLDDGRTVMCEVVTIFEVGGADYVALHHVIKTLPILNRKYGFTDIPKILTILMNSLC